MFRDNFDTGDLVQVREDLVIDGRDYTGQAGTIVQERFHVQGITLRVEFPGTALPSQWFHPDELAPHTAAQQTSEHPLSRRQMRRRLPVS